MGFDPLQFRLDNHVGPEGQPGERTTPPDEVVDTQPVEGGIPFSSNGLRQCLLQGAEAIGWDRLRDRPAAQDEGPKRIGVGMGMIVYRGGPGGRSSARMKLNADGSILLESGIMDVGQGSSTVLTQIAAQELGLSADHIALTPSDTRETLAAPITAGSTVTFSSGLAVQSVARSMRAKLLDAASSRLNVDPNQLTLRTAR